MRLIHFTVLLLSAAGPASAQLTWTPCTMPVNTLTLLALGPNGELVTLLNTNPAQPRISTDQGQTWTNTPGIGGPNGMLLSDARLHITITGSILVWGTVNGGGTYGLWRSADGGNTFSPAAGVPGNRYFMGFSSAPHGDVYVYGEGVLRSTDDGQTWTSIVGANIMLTSLAVNATHIWGVHLNDLYRGDPDGTAFAPIATGSYAIGNGLGVARGMNERIIAVGGGDRLITTTDGGLSWQSPTAGITSTLNNELQHVAASLGSDTWVTAKQVTVFSTGNGGAPWANAGTGLGFAGNEPIQGIFCDSTGTFYLYGYFHLYRSGISTGQNAPEAGAEISVYPVPSTGVVWLKDVPAGIPVQVIDLAGRHVRRLMVEHDGLVDLGALESGRYLLRIGPGPAVPVQIQH